MDKTLSVSEILKDAWELAKKNIWILLGFTVIQFIFIFAVTILTGLIGGISGGGVLIQNVVLSLFDAFNYFFTICFQTTVKIMKIMNPRHPAGNHIEKFCWDGFA